MTPERLTYDNAHNFAEKLLERGEKIKGVMGNIDPIRQWVIENGNKKLVKVQNGEFSIFGKTFSNEFNGQTITYQLDATDDRDPDSVDAFGSLILNADLKSKNDEIVSVTMSFRNKYLEDEDLEEGEEETGIGMENALLECRMFAHEIETDRFYDAPWKSIHTLSDIELESAFQFTSSIRANLK